MREEPVVDRAAAIDHGAGGGNGFAHRPWIDGLVARRRQLARTAVEECSCQVSRPGDALEDPQRRSAWCSRLAASLSLSSSLREISAMVECGSLWRIGWP